MAANAGMVAGSRDGVVTIRRDGDGPAVRLPRFPSLHLRFGPFRFDLCRGGAGRPVYLAASRASPGELARPRLGLTGRAGVARGCLGLLRSRVGILLRGVGGGMWIRWIAVCDSPPSAGGVD
jgi:hypothetical protein